MTFNTAAENVIKKSINNALYIDDNLWVPFEERPSSSEATICENLYKDFQKNNCSIDFFKFSLAEKSKTTNRLKGKDLLILDWNLIPNAPKHSLEILEQAILQDGLHFVCIYTNEQDVNSILYRILFYFKTANINSDLIEKIKLDINVIEEDPDLKEYFDAKKSSFYELAFSKEKTKKRELLGELKKNELNIKSSEDYVVLGGVYQKLDMSQNRNDYHIGNIYPQSETSHATIQINHTIVSIISKSANIEATGLYSTVLDGIIKADHSLFLLLHLEMRNLLIENPTFLGNELFEIEEKALLFFLNKGTSTPNFDFDFEMKYLWKESFGGLLFEQKSAILNQINDYQINIRHLEITDVAGYIANNSDKSVPIKEIAKINYLFNVLPFPKHDKVLRFGDIFIDINSSRYFLCLTPHCICIRPNKIKNNFYFIEGNESKMITALESPENQDNFISFIKKDDEIIAITWGLKEVKPFTMYIPITNGNESINDNKEIKTHIGGIECTLKYLCTLKENYTQRIANKAFTYPLSVGITYIQTREEDTTK